ncbi:hypothetical protein EJ05DRAFT_480552 [Pseudovirgaria hyperparasitica]|uniref:U6 snRNA phosphodiesterase n=1 Tax=Pseudovirgaria hyperparasitica TaxID=470096 RepID=A0A6A6VTH8_9PEZI|nr:uncharacterized protein EJ05DRAFT_480552 [Pseudovirgaria hyperparasitica]KAF2753189.1 hypothetical protein EJ05DRAFT_480552 [Pseudovirgaria hyperparasitica]
MGLVDYSDSDDDDLQDAQPLPRKANTNNALKRKHDNSTSSDLPPLPDSFHDLYSYNARTTTEDDPALHGGRIRAVPHRQGNWPSHVYLEWHPNSAESTVLNSLVDFARKTAGDSPRRPSGDTPIRPRITSLLTSDIQMSLPLHISLSRSLTLTTAQKDSFYTKTVVSLKQSGVRPFHIKFTSLRWVPNHSRTRYFLVAGIDRPDSDELNRLLDASNRAAASLDLDQLYDDKEAELHDHSVKTKKQHHGSSSRSDSLVEVVDRTHCFHVSLAWALQPICGPNFDEASNVTDLMSSLRSMNVHFNSVKVKIGNKVDSVDLSTKYSEPENGLIV